MHIGFWELVVVFAVALLVLGPDKLPYYAKKLGEALQSFRGVSKELTDELQKSVVELKDLEKSVKDLGKPVKAGPAAEAAPEPEPPVEAPAGDEAPAPDMNYADGI